MLIDAHTHILLDPGRPGQEAHDLLTAMDRAGVDQAAVFASTISDLTTERLLRKIAPHPDRLFAIGTVSPLLPEFRMPTAEVARLLESGAIRGLKFYTGYEHFWPHDPRLRPWLRLLAEHGRPAIFHMGSCYGEVPGPKLKYAHPLKIDELAVEMPELNIIIAHFAPPWVETTAEVCYKNKNVYTDCSGFTYGAFDERHERMFRNHWRTIDDGTYGQAGSKVLFGSDWPISDMPDYVRLVRDLAGAAADAVFGGTAARLFGLRRT